MGADHTVAGEMLAEAADRYRVERREVPLCHPDCQARKEVEGEIARLRGQLERADRLAEAAERLCDLDGQAADFLDPALAAFRAAREGGNQ